MRRGGFSLVEALLAGVVFFLILMVYQGVFSAAHGGEGRDLRRTEAMVLAAELMEQVMAVHQAKGDLPLVGRLGDPAAVPESFTLMECLGGEVHVSPLPEGFTRTLAIDEMHVGEDDALLRPDRSYLVSVRVGYPGPFGEGREVELVNVRARRVIQRTRLRKAPWEI